MTFTHVYEDVITMTSTTGVTAAQSFSCNGLYDPNITGTGHQPYYFDQLTALYNHYCVIGSKITAEVTPINSSQVAMKFGIIVDDNLVTTVTAPETMDEFPQGTMKLVAPSSMGGKIFITKKWSAKKFFGGSTLSNTELQGDSGNNPVEQSYFRFALQATDAATTCACAVKFKISYIAVWKELKDIAPS